MDISSSSLQLQDGTTFPFDCQSLLDQSNLMSDAGYYSASLSPTSSIDSCGFSPPPYSCGTPRDIPQMFTQVKSQPSKRTGRPRSKFPGVKRQNASEREKLRMRDLTKALQNLRTYLPPSVAPAGKNLTKIETLRHAIQYISTLTEKLGIGEAKPIQTKALPSTFDHFSGASSVATSLPAQPCYQNTDEGHFLTFQAQDLWISQQHNFFHGPC